MLFALSLLLLLYTPLSVRLRTDQTSKVFLEFLFFRFLVYPKRKKAKIRKYSRAYVRRRRRLPRQPTARADEEPEVLDVLAARLPPLLKKIPAILVYKRVEIVVAAADPAKTALLYAGAAGALAGLLEVLDEYATLREARGGVLSLAADFTATRSRVVLDVRLAARLLYLLRLLWQLVRVARKDWKMPQTTA